MLRSVVGCGLVLQMALFGFFVYFVFPLSRSSPKPISRRGQKTNFSSPCVHAMYTYSRPHPHWIALNWKKRYSCAKAALHALAMNLAVHYGPDGINANAVAIGTVASPAIWEGALENDGDILKKIGSRIPRRTVGSPDEAAAVLTFLASPDAALINGTVIVADGGWTIAAGTSHDGPGSWFDA